MAEMNGQPAGNPNAAKSKRSINDMNDPTVLWKDRKRILGMPISFTRYQVDEDRFTSRIGLFSTTTNEILLYRILDLKMKQKFSQKLFGCGTIVLYTADQSDSQYPLLNIKHPDKVRRFLSNLIEEERQKRRIVGREMFGVAGDGMSDINGDGIPD